MDRIGSAEAIFEDPIRLEFTGLAAHPHPAAYPESEPPLESSCLVLMANKYQRGGRPKIQCPDTEESSRGEWGAARGSSSA